MSTQPPPYGMDKGPGEGYGQPAGGYAPPPAGYAGPPAGYTGPPAGYAGQPAGYAGPPAGPPAGAYGQQGAYAPQTTVIMAQPQAQNVIIQRQGVNHALHCIISFFFWPWVIVWIVLCITDGN